MAVSSISPSPNLFGYQISQFQAERDARSPVLVTRSVEDSTIARFSVFGQFQASLADIQGKAQSLMNLSKPPTFQDLQLAVQGVVQSLNSLKEVASRFASKQAADDARKAADGNEQDTVSALQKAGISQREDGTFSVDNERLKGLFRNDQSSALSSVIEAADRFAPVGAASAKAGAGNTAVAYYASIAAL